MKRLVLVNENIGEIASGSHLHLNGITLLVDAIYNSKYNWYYDEVIHASAKRYYPIEYKGVHHYMKFILRIDEVGYGARGINYDYGIRILGYDDTYMFISDIEDLCVPIN